MGQAAFESRLLNHNAGEDGEDDAQLGREQFGMAGRDTSRRSRGCMFTSDPTSSCHLPTGE